MGLTVFLSMSSVVAANTVEEVGTFGAGVTRGELPTGRAGVGRTIHPKVTSLFTFEALFQRKTL